MAAPIPRIRPDELRKKLAHGDEPLLVCAYDDAAKCSEHFIPGAMHLAELEAKLPSLGRQQEIVFYCA